MDVNNRKTALDDDSILYQKRDETINKENVRNLNGKGRLRYFADYYLLKVVAVIAVLAFAVSLIYSIVFHRQETVLAISNVGTYYIEDPERIALDLRPVYQLTDKDQVINVNNYTVSDYNQQMAFSTHIAARELDILIMDQEQFDRYSVQGLFADLSEILDPALFEEVKDQLVYAHTEERDMNNALLSSGEDYPMALDVSDSEFFRSRILFNGPLYLGCSTGSQRQENEVTFLNYLFHPEQFADLTEQAQ